MLEKTKYFFSSIRLNITSPNYVNRVFSTINTMLVVLQSIIYLALGVFYDSKTQCKWSLVSLIVLVLISVAIKTFPFEERLVGSFDHELKNKKSKESIKKSIDAHITSDSRIGILGYIIKILKDIPCSIYIRVEDHSNDTIIHIPLNIGIPTLENFNKETKDKLFSGKLTSP